MGVYLTYNNLALKDGSGAQVQRIFAIYSLAKKMKIGYLHSQILEIDFNPGDGVSNHEKMMQYKEKLNESLDFLSTERIENEFRINFKLQRFRVFLNMSALHFIYYRLFFLSYKFRHKITKKNYVFVISDPYPLISKIPNSYLHVKHIMPVTDDKQSKKMFSIHLHLFRTRVSRSVQKERYTEDTWYLSILDQLSEMLKSNSIDFEIVLHTDINENAFWEIPSGSNKQTIEYWKAAGVNISGQLMATPQLDILNEFKRFRNLKIVSGIDAVEAWKLISQADIFLMGKSSFSFVGAIYNKKGIIITPEFFIPPLSLWYVVKENSNLDLGKIPNLVYNVNKKLRNL
jgi:hypothetical protein